MPRGKNVLIDDGDLAKTARRLLALSQAFEQKAAWVKAKLPKGRYLKVAYSRGIQDGEAVYWALLAEIDRLMAPVEKGVEREKNPDAKIGIYEEDQAANPPPALPKKKETKPVKRRT